MQEKIEIAVLVTLYGGYRPNLAERPASFLTVKKSRINHFLSGI